MQLVRGHTFFIALVATMFAAATCSSSSTSMLSFTTSRLARGVLNSNRRQRITNIAAFASTATHTSSSRRPAKYTAIYSSQRILPLERPPDPSSLSSVQNQTQILREWMRNKQSIVCITGAGMSTESGIPDYRGAKGSYFRGHKPIIHHEFMSSPSQRKRYWARSLVGYSPFANAQPNLGHEALARLEEMKCIGVNLEECIGFDSLGDSCFGYLGGINGEEDTRRISVITQNVDTLHSKAGLKHCLHLHGRGDLVRCMNCGMVHDRKEYHNQLTEWNQDWLKEAMASSSSAVENDNRSKKKAELRPDGDAELGRVSYDGLILPPCPHCGITMDEHKRNITQYDNHQQDTQSFFKTDVVFFGDSVPKHRFDISYAAVDAADGILVIGTSLAVHSAFRLVKRGIEQGTPVAILNVGETRVEKEGLGFDDGLVTKLESPIGETLSELVTMMLNEGDEQSVEL